MVSKKNGGINNRGQLGINDVSIAGTILIYLTLISIIFTGLEHDFGKPSTTTTLITEVAPDSFAFTGYIVLFEDFANYMTFAVGTSIPLIINIIFLWIPKLLLLFIAIKNLVPFLGGG